MSRDSPGSCNRIPQAIQPHADHGLIIARRMVEIRPVNHPRPERFHVLAVDRQPVNPAVVIPAGDCGSRLRSRTWLALDGESQALHGLGKVNLEDHIRNYQRLHQIRTARGAKPYDVIPHSKKPYQDAIISAMWYFTSDQHFGHQRIIDLARRPFDFTPAGLAEMNAELIRRHNERVTDDDDIAFLGDFAMGKISGTLPVIRLLNGRRKVLIAGNHDRCSPAYGLRQSRSGRENGGRHPDEIEMWADRYRETGFTEVWAYQYVFKTLFIAGKHPATLCHFPYKGGWDSRAAERFGDLRPEDEGGWLLCGHVHQRWQQRGRMINVGVDAWSGYPVSEEQVARMIEAGPMEREAQEWQ